MCYCVFKDEYDNFYIGEFMHTPQLFFRGVQITKININTRYCYYYHAPSIKGVSELFFDSIVTILHCTRDEVVSIINEKKSIGNNMQPGSKLLFIDPSNYCIINTIIHPNGYKTYDSITINTDEFFPGMWRNKRDVGAILLVDSELERYYLDNCTYDIIVNKIRQTHKIIRNLLIDKYNVATP